MLGKISQWWAARLEEKEDEHLRLRYDALTRLKVATLQVLQLAEDRASAAAELSQETDDVGTAEAAAAGENGSLQSVAAENNATGAAQPSAVLTQDDPCVHDLCIALDGCVKLGLKKGSGAEPDMTWWQVLHSSTMVVEEPAFLETVVSAAVLSETEGGRERCWLKLALNNHTLEISLMMIFSLTCEPLIRSSYEEWSLMRCSEGLAMFLQMVIEIRSVQFVVQVDDEPFHGSPEASPPMLFPPPSPTNAALDGINEDASSGNATTPTEGAANALPTGNAENAPSTAAESAPTDQASDGPNVPNEEEIIELPTVNFLHRHKGIKPWQHVFGVSLAYLCRNPYHSRFALIDPVLAIPNVVQDCIDFLMEHPNSPRLFRATVFNVHMNQLREIVETDGALPLDIDPNGAGALLLDFFKNLPEPLLTSEKYDAFVASGRLRDEEASVRNIACLVQELPIHCKVVLEKVIGLMHVLQLPEHAEHNGVDAMTTSTALAPVIAFKLEPSHALPAGHRRSTHSHYQDVRYAAVGAQVVERMIQHYDVIFQDVRLQVSDALKRLEAKKQALLTIHQLFKMKPQVNFMSDKLHLDEMSVMFAESCSIEAGHSLASLRLSTHSRSSEGSNNSDEYAHADSNINSTASDTVPLVRPPSSPRVHSMIPITPEAGPPAAISFIPATIEGATGSTTVPPSPPSPTARTASGTGINTLPTFRTASGTGTRIGVLTRRQTVATTTGSSSSSPAYDGLGRSRAASEFTSPYADPDNRPLIEIWEKHGFNRPTVLGNFDKGGVLLLRSVAYMLKNYKSEVMPRLYERALPCATASFDAGLVASAIVRSLVHLLKLVPSPEAPNLNLVALSVEPFWELFDEDGFFYKLFVLMFQMFDQIWSLLDPQEVSFTRVFCETEARMDELLKKSPACVDDVRVQWNELYQELHHDILDEASKVAATNDGTMGANAELVQGDRESDSAAYGVTSPSTSTACQPSPPRFSRKPSFVFNTDDYKCKLLDASGILTLEHIAYLDHAVPITCQLCRWCLLYSTETHGSSLDTLLLLTKNQSPTMLVIKDDRGNVFGGFASDEWHRAAQYFGNGESFLFSFANAKGSSSSGGDANGLSGVSSSTFSKYPWSRKNSYFMLCSEESLVMGGGGSFGLYLDSDLSRGTTGPCETYSSRPLVSSQEFNCLLVEVWGFTSGDRPTGPIEPRKKSVLD